MLRDICMHGATSNHIEYFAYLAGGDVSERYRFNVGNRNGSVLRVCSAGNEFIIGEEGVAYRGNGGGFCEYMFGIDHPLADLAKSDVRNRLAMYGACYEDPSGALLFTDITEGTQSYERIFFDGNAVSNYFFFVNSSPSGRE